MIHSLHVKVINPGAGIMFSWLSGVQFHSSIFSHNFDNSKQLLLKALVFHLVKIFWLQTANSLPHAFQGIRDSRCICLIMFNHHYSITLQQTTATLPHDDLLDVSTPVTMIILEETRIKSINPVWMTSHVWEFQKIWPKNDDFWTARLSCSACVQFFQACATRKSALMIFKNKTHDNGLTLVK